MSQLYENNSSARLISDTQPGDTTVTLAPGEGDRFPQPDAGDVESFAMLTLEDVNANFEIVKMPERNGDILTIERGQEDTAPAGFATGSRIECRLTAGSLDGFQQKVDRWDLRGDMLDTDGVRYWHITDPSSYQFFQWRFFSDYIGNAVMFLEPPAGIGNLSIAAAVTATSGELRGWTLRNDIQGILPAPGTGKVYFEAPGAIRNISLTDPLGAPSTVEMFDVYDGGAGTAYKQSTTTTGSRPVRYGWMARNDLDQENEVLFLEDGSISCNTGLELRNGSVGDYPNAQDVKIEVVALPYAADTYDWVLWTPSELEGASRGLAYTITTVQRDSTVDPVEFNYLAISFIDGQVTVPRDPVNASDLTRKSWVEAQIANAVTGGDLDAIGSTLYGRTVLWNNDSGTNDGSVQTLVDSLQFDQFFSVQITAKENDDYYTITIDSETMLDKGFSPSGWIVAQATGTAGDTLKKVRFNPLSLTTFSCTVQGGSGGSIVRVLGLNKKEN